MRMHLEDSLTPIKHKKNSYYRSPRRRMKKAEILFEEIIAENDPNMQKETDIQIQEAQRTSIKINKSRSTPGHIITGKHMMKKKRF